MVNAVYKNPQFHSLILGGVRSGKSRYAQSLAAVSGLPVVYIATATTRDVEMQARIEKHRAERPADWVLIEESIALAMALQQHAAQDRCLIVDCLTLWLTNLLLLEDDAELERQREELLKIAGSLPGRIIFVSNEVNMGVVPMGQLSRRFCDEAGVLHQALATQCEQVVLMVAGLPLQMKG
ncbi:MAG: bifunctional adenosylcobinamide kinase/adenosylcobinamide-phosphate guanylyltransferase [Gammaproteobacteria bacterium]|nr:bifunctional adenosylcobinamide kinase/adenosylcobinamide-phosphate guanylyltransferase [Gammaproteobacteria bacterium]